MDIRIWLFHILNSNCQEHRFLAYPTAAWYHPKGSRPFETILRYPLSY